MINFEQFFSEAAMGVKIDALDNPQIDYVQAIEK